MASVAMSNGMHNAMPLTEYTASPNLNPTEHTPASAIVDPCYLRPDGHPDYPRLILRSRVYKDHIVTKTPLTPAHNLSKRLGCEVLLKREDQQSVFSFKIRGAFNRMGYLSEEERWKGVIACSAGNHAQGVAQAARHLKIPATIVMPSGTPSIKHLNVFRLGGSVVLHGEDFDAAKSEAYRLQKLHGLTNIPPFDDPYIIAGQGTIGLELSRQADLEELEAVFCCVGGGGLLAGIGSYLKYVAPDVKIIGVETHDANAMTQSWKKGKRVVLDEVGLFADGAAVKTVGEETFRLCKEVIDDMIEVTTDETCAAVKDIYEETRGIVEPAGALALAGLKKYAAQHPSTNPKRQLVALASGANMNFDKLRFIAERAALGERKEALLGVRIPERPGAFAELVNMVLPHAITEFSYRYANEYSASIFMGISVNASTRDSELSDLIRRLSGKNMEAADLTEDEVAKSHLRYLVGGRSGVHNERLYMFEFPERPGALARFLTTLRPDQNISLFHYRNHGGDVGKVLAGIQCPQHEQDEMVGFLKKLGYPFSEVTDSPTYKMFLRQ